MVTGLIFGFADQTLVELLLIFPTQSIFKVTVSIALFTRFPSGRPAIVDGIFNSGINFSDLAICSGLFRPCYDF